MPGGHQPTQRVLDLAARVQRRLEEVDVELDAEGLQVRILLLAKLLDREPPDRVEVGSRGIARLRRNVALGDLADVVAVVAPLGHRRAPAGPGAASPGFALSALASTSARFVATSPWAGSRGRDSSTADSGTGAPSRPAAAASAARIASCAFTCRRSLFSSWSSPPASPRPRASPFPFAPSAPWAPWAPWAPAAPWLRPPACSR